MPSSGHDVEQQSSPAVQNTETVNINVLSQCDMEELKGTSEATCAESRRNAGEKQLAMG